MTEPSPISSISAEPRVRNAASRIPWLRWILKSAGFAAFTLLVLNPHLSRSIEQIQRTLRPEALIQTNFPALQQINREIDGWLAGGISRQSEPEVIEAYVCKRIRYLDDYSNWLNVEYWPDAEQVWSRAQEDCDGRAILAASILRSRGYSSARLAVGLDHMWVRLNANEKTPGAPPNMIALLSPGRRLSLDLAPRTGLDHALKILRALADPAALRETTLALVSDIPGFRKALLIVFLVIACHHPSRNWRVLGGATILALAGALLLNGWEPNLGAMNQFLVGAGLCGAAILVALLGSRSDPRHAIPPGRWAKRPPSSSS